MAEDLEVKLRGPGAYNLARAVIEQMERHKVWPTPLNFEIWSHVVSEPTSPLGSEVSRLISSGTAFTDRLSIDLAERFLPRIKLNEQIRDAGDQLSRELASVSKAIASAQKSSEAYGETLASASKSLDEDGDLDQLRSTVTALSTATERVQKENKALERQLAESSAEVAKLREHLAQVSRDATTDALTQLKNRRAFDLELERLCAECQTKGSPLTLALIDIDHFKSFNDTWGHQTGDQVIRFVASVIGRVAAAPRFAARYGGEEFAMIFPAEAGARVAAVLDSMRDEVGSRLLKRRSTNEDLGAITISAGYAELQAGESIASLTERADMALYACKRGGRNQVRGASVASSPA